MPDVAKLKKRALEFEQKKQFDKALDTYTQVLAELDEHVDEADVALYNRVGDLLLRRGDVGEAVDHYEKAVDLYTDGGFFNNAIALCNKILRNAPGRNSVYYKLGKISARKGFINDAKQNFLEYADRMQKAGQLEEAFRALKEFADLCPDQDDIRLMLADQLVRKDRKSEAIEQLHALYDKFSAEGRSAEARATVDRMKALDPALEPREAPRPAPAKARDLIFLDVNYDEPARPRTASAPVVAPEKTQWSAVPPITPPAPPVTAAAPPVVAPPVVAPPVVAPPVAAPALVLDTTNIESDEDIVIDLASTQTPDVAPLTGLSHGAMLPDGAAAPGGDIVSHVDVAFITGFEDSAVASADTIETGVAPLEGLEPSSHLELPGDDLLSPDASEQSMLAGMELDGPSPLELSSLEIEHETPSPELSSLEIEHETPSPELSSLEIEHETPSPELSSLEIDRDTPSGGELPMLDVPDDEPDDDGVSLGGSLTFLSIDAHAELSALPEIGAAEEPEPALERAAEPEDVEPRAQRSSGAAAISSESYDPELDVELSPALEFDATVPDGGPPLPMLDVDGVGTGSFDRENALAGLPMLDPDQLSPLPADEEVEESVELLWETAPAAVPAPISPLGPRASSPTPIPPALSRVEQLRLQVAHAPAAWDLHRQLAEALLEQGDRAGGITELEATMFGYERAGDLANASRSADELIRVEPDSVRYHQKRVEYAVRANDKPQLVDAYLSLAESLFRSGQLDKSRAVYGRVLELSPADARASSALRELGVEIEPAAEQGAAPEPASPSHAPLAMEVERTSSTLPIDDELFAALETALPEAPPRAPAPMPPQRPPVAAADDESFVNLSDWLREDEPPRSTRMVSPGEEEPEEQQDFADMLTKFKQGVTSNVDDTDHESHYDLGVAYKEMGLLDEAISEFQKALRGSEQRVRTYEALGQCFVEKRQYQIAMTILLRALNDAGASDDTLVGVLYLLGYASESLQKWEDAVGYYERVFTVDIQFRDVGDRLSAVERKAGR